MSKKALLMILDGWGIIKRAFLLIIFQYLNYHSDFRAQRYKKDGYVNV